MSLHALDLVVIALYFVVIAGIGFYATRGQRTAEQYFVAGRSIPMWAVAFTIMATIISTGTFVGHPGTAYQRDSSSSCRICWCPSSCWRWRKWWCRSTGG